MACGLFFSLASLFRICFLSFQELADSFAKKKGVGGVTHCPVPSALLREPPSRYILGGG
jgi:hypothetical protein